MFDSSNLYKNQSKAVIWHRADVVYLGQLSVALVCSRSARCIHTYTYTGQCVLKFHDIIAKLYDGKIVTLPSSRICVHERLVNFKHFYHIKLTLNGTYS